MKFFKSLPAIWQLVVVVIIIVVIVAIYKRYGSKLFQSKDISPSNIILSDGTVVTVTSQNDLPQETKDNLKQLATDIKSDIYESTVYHGVDIYDKASSLSDVEIDYLADYYKQYLTNGISLYQDMNEDYCFVDCDSWNLLKRKLEKTGNR